MMVTRADWIDRAQMREAERIVSAQVYTSVEGVRDIATLIRDTTIY